MISDTLWQDLRIAARSLARSPGFVVAAVLSLALAIGASASAFSVIDAIRFRALPFADADRLVLIAEVPAGDAGAPAPAGRACSVACDVSYVTFSTVLRSFPFRAIDRITAHQSGVKALTRNGDTEALTGTVATPETFPLLRVQPERGRSFTADDDRLGATPVTMLSHELWVSHFGSDASIIGTPVQLSDTRYVVIGIMPAGFDFESGARFWLPIVPTLDPSTRPSIRSATVIGHLTPGATIEQLRSELAVIEPVAAPRAGGAAPEKTRLTAEPLRSRYTTASQGREFVFAAIVACVLLIACANLTNLLLVRAVDQQREMAVRAALGASPSRLAGAVALQHAILMVAGALFGVAFAAWFVSVLRTVPVLNSFRPTALEYRVDFHVIGFAVIITAVAAVAVSVIPLGLVRSRNLFSTLREGAPGDTLRTGQLRRAFVALQVACAVALLIGAGLEVRTVGRLSQVDLGFDAAHVTLGSPSYPHDWRVKAKFVPTTHRILDAIRTLPGATQAAVRATTPLGTGRTPPAFTVGRGVRLSQVQTPAAALAITPGYFSTMGVALAHGRDFTDDDREASAPVAIVNAWAAARWWPGEEAVGQQLQVDTTAGAPPLMLTVVGVAGDNKAARPNLILAADGPELYVPYDQAPSAFPSFFVKTAGSPSAIIRPFRELLVHEVPDRPVTTIGVATQAEQQLSGIRTTAIEVLAFAGVGLLLAIIGVYGVVAYAVVRRTRELGIRRALGASEAGLTALVVSEALKLAVIGFAFGAIAAYFGARLMAPILYGTEPRDVAVYALIGIVILAVTTLAALVPALRAARISPTIALRAT